MTYKKFTGKVTPPKDLQPAIDALGSRGRSYLRGLSQGQTITPLMLAKAADFERGESLSAI